MKPGIQTFLAEAGESACYALDIIKIASRVSKHEFEPLVALEAGIDNGFIYYNHTNSNDNENFYVSNPAAFLSLLTSDKWSITKESADYKPKPGEYIVERWERAKTGSTTGHFKLPDWDSLYDSQTVKYGKLASLRVFRRIA